VEEYYAPATAHARVMTGDWTAAKDFAAWQDQVRACWPGVRITGVDVSGIDTEPALGHPMTVRAVVDLAGLSEQDVQVQTVVGRVGADQQLFQLNTVRMEHVGDGDGYGHRFQAQVPLRRAGALGYTVRVLPRHPLLASPAELGLVTTPE